MEFDWATERLRNFIRKAKDTNRLLAQETKSRNPLFGGLKAPLLRFLQVVIINYVTGSKSKILELASCAMDQGQAKLLRKLNDKQGVSVSCSTSTTQLCDLPDSLLHHILSFLPTKFAFRTSVLSKRWQHVSESMPCLRFGERDFQNFLCDAVESALRCRDMSCSIQEFSLECSLENGIFRINRWIAAAVKGNVKVLKLLFAVGNLDLPYRLPYCIFMSETLVELELVMDTPLIIPTSTRLSNLKILTLERVIFVDEESTQKLLSCPTLEELSIRYCGWNDIKSLKVYAPSLLKLLVMDWPLCYIDERSDFPHTCQVLIQGAQIRSLVCRSWFLNKYCITTSPLLLEANVKLDCDSETDPLMVQTVAANNASMLLNVLTSVQSLTLNSSILEQICSRHELFNALPTFSKLTMLSLDCSDDSITHPRWYSWAMFERFPHLETLEYVAFRFDDTPSNPPDLAPICFRSHLKKIVVYCFEPKKPNFSHLVQLLGISMCLEELVIRHHQNISHLPYAKDLMQHLTRLPKASAKCRISVW